MNSIAPISVLSRIGQNSSSALTPFQGQMDGLVGNFTDQATDGKTLAAMTVGGFAYRMGKVGLMSLSQSPLIRPLAVIFGLGTEVTAFEFTHRTFLSLSQNPPTPLRQRGARRISQSLEMEWIRGMETRTPLLRRDLRPLEGRRAARSKTKPHPSTPLPRHGDGDRESIAQRCGSHFQTGRNNCRTICPLRGNKSSDAGRDGIDAWGDPRAAGDRKRIGLAPPIRRGRFILSLWNGGPYASLHPSFGESF